MIKAILAWVRWHLKIGWVQVYSVDRDIYTRDVLWQDTWTKTKRFQRIYHR